MTFNVVVSRVRGLRPHRGGGPQGSATRRRDPGARLRARRGKPGMGASTSTGKATENNLVATPKVNLCSDGQIAELWGRHRTTPPGRRCARAVHAAHGLCTWARRSDKDARAHAIVSSAGGSAFPVTSARPCVLPWRERSDDRRRGRISYIDSVPAQAG